MTMWFKLTVTGKAVKTETKIKIDNNDVKVADKSNRCSVRCPHHPGSEMHDENSGVDSIGHGGTCIPSLLQAAGHGGGHRE